MSMQARMSKGDPRLYNSFRDVAHNFGDMVRVVADRLEAGAWPAVSKMLADAKVSEDELGRACRALLLFTASSADDPKESMSGCMARSGWDDVAPAAQLAVMAVLGTVVTGYHFAGAREATMGGEGPCLRYGDLAERGQRCSELMMQSRLTRARRRLWARVLRTVDALRGRKDPGWKYTEFQADYVEGMKAAAAAEAAGRKPRAPQPGKEE